MDEVYTVLTDRARELHQKSMLGKPDQPARILIALAGPSRSGKSTVGVEVVHFLNKESLTAPYAAVLPMDGFQLTRATLDSIPNSREAHARRGIH
ncbi:uncharacterized protein A1O5_09003 [Cladophialophora psammophila CBS 110553]|uniref:Phosphoribulokinase/uridine kinase domain-containing protein n=1 Tax=Cladophialophora psammophila CBS 110553 TaxID=1182543 RepID=W9WHN7_9EURO|nr:uncharacterized protein A1O5_09003 [Cladophialophora psammophila CBS 110553]EXJ67657.1 hypothetical protein A1O5_09003 [Cladophialophora psammophila CBS 110553]